MRNYAADNVECVPPVLTSNPSAFFGTPNTVTGIMPNAPFASFGLGARLSGNTTVKLNSISYPGGDISWHYWLYSYMPNYNAWIDPAHAQMPNPWDGAGGLGSAAPPSSWYNPVGSVDGAFWWMNYGCSSVLGTSVAGKTSVATVYSPAVPYGSANDDVTYAPNFRNIDLQTQPADTMVVMDAGEYMTLDSDCMVTKGIHYLPGTLTRAGGATQTLTAGTAVGFNVAWTPQFAASLPMFPYLKTDVVGGRHTNGVLNSLMVDGHAVSQQQAFILQCAAEANGYNYGGINYAATPSVTDDPAWWFYQGAN
jgi:prepilin-type processing-associated H-X9-DG protein